ncbi:F420-dependent glucose-6-phosphate dehydrogenase [Streptomyces sp. enrichment culture]
MPDTTPPPARPGRPSFGVMAAPLQVGYDDLVRVWREADEVPEIEHAWVLDHLMPIWGDPEGPAFEGWTLLSALAAQTRRLRLGVMVTSNRLRPPALLAKIATTVDIVSGGRLDFGIGVGSRRIRPRRGGSTRRTGCRSTTRRRRWRASPRPAC